MGTGAALVACHARSPREWLGSFRLARFLRPIVSHNERSVRLADLLDHPGLQLFTRQIGRRLQIQQFSIAQH